jgi:hypothetical protein
MAQSLSLEHFFPQSCGGVGGVGGLGVGLRVGDGM